MIYEKRIITYKDYGKLLDQLCKKITKGYQYGDCPIEAVYGPSRGGLPIAVHISHHFNCDLVLSINDLYKYAVNKKHFIVVDDIIDTGKTMLEIPKKLMYTDGDTASLFYKKRSKFKPRFYIKEIPDNILFGIMM